MCTYKHLTTGSWYKELQTAEGYDGEWPGAAETTAVADTFIDELFVS